MLNRIYKYTIAVVFMLLSVTTFAQMMAPNDPGSGPQAGDPPIGGGAPIGSGMFVMMALGAAYGGKKVFHLVTPHNKEN